MRHGRLPNLRGYHETLVAGIRVHDSWPHAVHLHDSQIRSGIRLDGSWIYMRVSQLGADS